MKRKTKNIIADLTLVAVVMATGMFLTWICVYTVVYMCNMEGVNACK